MTESVSYYLEYGDIWLMFVEFLKTYFSLNCTGTISVFKKYVCILQQICPPHSLNEIYSVSQLSHFHISPFSFPMPSGMPLIVLYTWASIYLEQGGLSKMNKAKIYYVADYCVMI